MSEQVSAEIDAGTPRASVAVGFVGPLEEGDQDRCPLCGLDPNDPTLHAPDCSALAQNLCGVIRVGQICMAPEHMPDRAGKSWVEHWREWSAGHEWVDLASATLPAKPEEAH